MIQKFIGKIYGVFDKLFSGKEVRNGRKLFLTTITIFLFFICAIFIPSTIPIITDTVYVGGIVALVVAYIGGNVANKSVLSKKNE